MGFDSFRVSTVLPVSPERLYAAWLSSDEHTAFSGSGAAVDPVVGGRHTAWDGYIQGEILELEPGRRIVQSWRADDFPEDSLDSRLEVLIEPHTDGTELTIVHSEIPEGQGARFEAGWREYYFAPMAAYFGGGDPTLEMLEAVVEPMPAAAPVTAKVATKKTASRPAAKKAGAAKKPAVKRAAAKKPVARKAAAKKPAAKKPAAKKPAAKKPAAKKPAAKKPAAKKPAAKKPAARKPIGKKPVQKKAKARAAKKPATKKAGQKRAGR